MSEILRGAPRFATPRNPALPTLGPVVGKVSELVRGKKLMPWQQQVANVACELSRENPGEYRYDTVIITVPRQAGKSDLLGALHTYRMLAYKGHKAVMTAQTGKDAGKRWLGIVNDIDASAGGRVKVNRGKGYEMLEWTPTRSTLAPFAPTSDAIHGDALNMASIDEAWAFTQVQGSDLQTAIKPTFLTVPNSQLLIASTRGTANSHWLNNLIELGRASLNDPKSRIAFFEWSADPAAAEADPYSDATLAFHPAIGHTQTARKIRDLGGDMTLGEWRRSFLNLATETAETAIDMAVWDALRWNYEPDSPEKRDEPARDEDYVLAWDIALDGSSASIAAGWLDNDGNPAMKIIATAPGTAWLRPMLEKAARRGYRAIVSDDSGPNRTVAADLIDILPNEAYRWNEYAAACQSFLDRIREGTLSHDGSKAVRENLSCAVIRQTTKAQVFDAAKSAGPIDALRALLLAQYATAQLGAPVVQMF
ncbi:MULTISPECIES: hypothetical protein [unclassified Actinotignum]|uniref:hypothetical protein n=1 Tax=unclassified Actinotignum TaxID=2632702 RepID=UPI002A821031|nr:hypothetical protein [Actinotignum sp. SLA_B059]MDY5127458.1 hypothetical protein [Actinotignum sp. SLA_B059]